MDKEENVTIILYTESLWQSWLADLGTFVMLTGMFYANAHFIQSRLFAAIIVIMFVLKLMAYFGARKNVYTSRDEAISFLTNR